MPQQIGWSVEAKLLYEIKQLTKSLASRSYIQTFPNFASFPTPGITGTLYVDEATGDIYVWNGTSYVLLSSGITALNGLIAAAQLLVTGSTGTDFNISSVGTTHTFNIPTASATNRGLLSSADWTTFNSKIGGTGTTNYVPKFTGAGTLGNSQIFDNGTNVGIGTASPTSLLHVNGIAQFAANSGTLQIAAATPFFTGANISSGANTFGIGTTGANLIGLFTNNTERIRITSGGDVGIGITSPTAKLTVATADATSITRNAISITDQTNTSAVIQIGNSVINILPGGSSALALGSNNTERMRITSGGDVGIGTSSPSEKLDVSGFIRTTSGVKVTDGTIDFRLSWASGNVAFLGNTTNHPIDFYTNAAQRMRISSSGLVGIGNASPLALLHVGAGGTGTIIDGAGNTFQPQVQHTITSGVAGVSAMVNDGTNNRRAGLFVDQTNAVWGLSQIETSGSIPFVIRNAGGERLRITIGGNVLIGTTTDAGERFQVSGDARLTGNVYTNTSGGSNTRLAISATSNVGIGIAFAGTVSDRLHLNDGYVRYGSSSSFPNIYGRIGHTGNSGGLDIISQYDVAGNEQSANIRFINGINTATSEKMRITPNGVISVGNSSPRASIKPTLQIGTFATLWEQSSGAVNLAFGAYEGATNTYYYTTTGDAPTMYMQLSGTHRWFNAAAGTANAAFTFTERMRITSAGDVGIGTATPYNQASFVSLTIDGTSGSLQEYRRSGVAGLRTFTEFGASGFVEQRAAYLYFGTSATERMRITSGGNVGIGTSTPLGLLHVNGGDSYFGSEANAATNIVFRRNAATAGSIGTYNSQLEFSGGSSLGAGHMVITSTGNVGIGTTSVNAGRKLQINGDSSDSFIQLVTTTTGTTASDGFVIGVGNGTEAFLLNYENSPIKIFTGGNERMRISATGNVGINTNNPTGLFTILNGVEFFYVGFGANNDNYFTCGTNGIQVFRRGTTETARITSGGNVLIGTTTDPGDKLYVKGDIRIQNTGRIRGDLYSASYLIIDNDTTIGANRNILFLSAAIEQLRIDGNGNVGFTQTTFGTSATRTLAISTGVAPTTSPVDAIQMYSADVVAGNAAPHFRTENGAVVKVYQETTGVGAATLVGGGGTTITDTDTFDGYTLKQIVKALRNQGLLA